MIRNNGNREQAPTCERNAVSNTLCRWSNAAVHDKANEEFLGTNLCGRVVAPIASSYTAPKTTTNVNLLARARNMYQKVPTVHESLESALG